MAGVAGLTPAGARGPGLAAGGLGVGMVGTGRGRGVARRLVEPILQFLDLGEQRADDGLRFGRLAGDQFFRDLQRHALHVAEKQTPGQADSSEALPRAVADYVSEWYADGRVTRERLDRAWQRADATSQGIHLSGGGDVDQNPAQAVLGLGADLDVGVAAEMAAATFGAVARGEAYGRIWRTPCKENRDRWAEDDAIRLAATAAEGRVQAALLRDLFGHPSRPVVLDPAWLTPDVVALAHAAYEERELPPGTLDPARLAVLADALEDVGYREGQILQHLRGPGPHVRGCFVVDSLLGKS
jgi:hypothetical protein